MKHFPPSSRAVTLGVLASLATAHSIHPALAQTGAPVAVLVDGRPVSFGSQPPVQSGGRLLVPLRAIFEALGANVEFSNGVVRARRDTTNLELRIGSNQAIVNGQNRTLEVPAQAIFGRTLVPLRFVGEAFGAGVSFNNATQTVSISSPGGVGTGTIPVQGNGAGNGLPYTTPVAAQVVSGTLVRVEPGTASISVAGTDGATRTYVLNPNALALRQISLATTPTATPVRQVARRIETTALAPGDEVRLTLDSAGRVSQILTSATVIVARVQFAGGDQIVLDDERDTTLTIGNVAFTDATGRESTTANLGPGQTVALFLNRANRSIYRVSAYAPDYTPAATNTGTLDPLPGGGLAPDGSPQIQQVRHSATAPLRAGTRLEVAARATTRQTLAFSLGPRVQNVPLIEEANNPGNYRGTYTVRAGDDVLEARVLVRLTGQNGFEDTQQSAQPVTIDTVAPRLLGTFPAANSRSTVAQPNIVILADDTGGSGLGGANLEILSGGANNPTRTPLQATVAPPTSVNAVPPAPLSGAVTVRGQITDKAGNALPINFDFNVAANAGGGTILSFSHGANRALAPGEDIPLELRATPAGRASFDVLNTAGTLVARDVPMIEDGDEPSRYRATYRVPEGATGQLRFVGRFNPGDNTLSTAEATAPVNLVTVAEPTQLLIDTPREGAAATSPLVISGRAAPGAVVDVSIVAQGTQLFVFEYNEDLGTQQVRADAQGNWQTRGVQLPTRKNVAGLKYVVTATQTDAANRESDPVTITLRGR